MDTFMRAFTDTFMIKYITHYTLHTILQHVILQDYKNYKSY